MPGSFSTRTAIVALRRVVSGMCVGSTSWPAVVPAIRRGRGPPDGRDKPAMTVGLNQYESFVGDAGGFAFMLGAEDHLVVCGARRNHREAVLLRVHSNIGDDGAVD